MFSPFALFLAEARTSGRGARAILGRGDLRRNPAFGGDEGEQDDCGYQQRSGRANLPGGRCGFGCGSVRGGSSFGKESNGGKGGIICACGV